jgi:hypothetical protein
VGEAELRAWNASEANAALSMFASIVRQQLMMTDGYLVRTLCTGEEPGCVAFNVLH